MLDSCRVNRERLPWQVSMAIFDLYQFQDWAVFVPRLRGYRVKAQCIYCIGSRRLDHECTWFLYVQVLRGEVESGDDAN